MKDQASSLRRLLKIATPGVLSFNADYGPLTSPSNWHQNHETGPLVEAHYSRAIRATLSYSFAALRPSVRPSGCLADKTGCLMEDSKGRNTQLKPTDRQWRLDQ